jgi:hypothetical protein
MRACMRESLPSPAFVLRLLACLLVVCSLLVHLCSHRSPHSALLALGACARESCLSPRRARQASAHMCLPLVVCWCMCVSIVLERSHLQTILCACLPLVACVRVCVCVCVFPLSSRHDTCVKDRIPHCLSCVRAYMGSCQPGNICMYYPTNSICSLFVPSCSPNSFIMYSSIQCNQFGQQEPGTPEEIRKFVEGFGVTFPVMEKGDVNGDDTVEAFRMLKVTNHQICLSICLSI